MATVDTTLKTSLFVFQDLFIVSRSYVKNFSSSFSQIRDEALVTVVRKTKITKNTAPLMRRTRLLTTPSFSLLIYLTRRVKEKYWTVPGHLRTVSLRIWMEKKLKKMVKITPKQWPCLLYGEYIWVAYFSEVNYWHVWCRHISPRSQY